MSEKFILPLSQVSSSVAGAERMVYPRSPWEKPLVNANAECEMLL